jgi:predicted GNAT family N-acyltransferase
MSSFITHIPPPGNSLNHYNRSLPPAEQTKTSSNNGGQLQHTPSGSAVPQGFVDAMTVREAVFVNEQHVALERELDIDDSISHHWVVYASVAVKSKKKSIPLDEPLPAGSEGSPDSAPHGRPDSSHGRRRSGTLTTGDSNDRRRSSNSGFFGSFVDGGSTIAVGTIRAVPPPGCGVINSRQERKASSGSRPSGSASTSPTIHAQQKPSSSSTSPALLPQSEGQPNLVPSSAELAPHPTILLTPNEPYVRLGRLATLPAFRGHGLSKLLIGSALEYLRHHQPEFSPIIDLPEINAAIQDKTSVPEMWRGLVVVHAQKDNTEGLWRKFGFEIDEEMGEWEEEGMMHVGMWCRLEVGNRL